MGFVKYIDFTDLTPDEKKKLKNLLDEQKRLLKIALDDANRGLGLLKAKKSKKKSKKAKK
jgi:hypothetical protein